MLGGGFLIPKKIILGKIRKISATRCEILSQKCTKFDFHWGSAPDPLGSLQRSPGPLKGLLLGERGQGAGGEKKGGERKEGRGEKGRGRGKREGPVKSVKPRARKVASPTLRSTGRTSDCQPVLFLSGSCKFQ